MCGSLEDEPKGQSSISSILFIRFDSLFACFCVVGLAIEPVGSFLSFFSDIFSCSQEAFSRAFDGKSVRLFEDIVSDEEDLGDEILFG